MCYAIYCVLDRSSGEYVRSNVKDKISEAIMAGNPVLEASEVVQSQKGDAKVTCQKTQVASKTDEILSRCFSFILHDLLLQENEKKWVSIG